MAFDAFLDEAWRDHGDRPEEVAARLEQGYALIETPAQIAPFARILAHVDGEHLARWRDGVARLARLHSHPKWIDDGDAPAIVRRLMAALALAGGEPAPADLSAADRAHAHAVAASALAFQRKIGDAIGHFRAARAAAAPGLADGEPAIRALAVTANNLASGLEEAPSRSADETAAMLDAAAASRDHWGRAGTWLEAERAEYLLSRCHLAAGRAAAALAHAAECVAICARNDADDFERLFAHVALARARRASGDAAGFTAARDVARAHGDAVAADMKRWCEAALSELD